MTTAPAKNPPRARPDAHPWMRRFSCATTRREALEYVPPWAPWGVLPGAGKDLRVPVRTAAELRRWLKPPRRVPVEEYLREGAR